MEQQRFSAGDFWALEKRPNYFKYVQKNQSLTLTGSEQTVKIPVEFFHRILTIELTQYDAAGALSRASYNVTLSRGADRDNGLAKRTLWNVQGVVATDYAIGFGDRFEREPTEYELKITGANTNKMVIVAYIMKV